MTPPLSMAGQLQVEEMRRRRRAWFWRVLKGVAFVAGVAVATWVLRVIGGWR